MHDVQFSRTPDFATPLNRLSILGSRTDVGLHGGLWYWRVWDRGYPADTVSATGSFTIVDTDPPVGKVVLNGGLAYVPEIATVLPVDTQQQDLFGSLATLSLSWNGQNWTSYPVTATGWSINLPITAPEAGGTTPGRRDVWIEWEDADGNLSSPIKATVWYAMQPPNVPGAPGGVSAIAGAGQAELSWTPPVDDGGSPVTAYTVTASPGGAMCTTTGAASCTVAGLTNGTAYSFTVRAENEVGYGPASGPSALVKPLTTPGAPTAITAVPGFGSATVSWTAPISNGGSVITGYTVNSAPPGSSCSPSPATGTSCTVVGLTDGTFYTFTVSATNAAGTGPNSEPSAPITPTAGPIGRIAALPTYERSTSFTIAWGATAGSSSVVAYDVRVRRAAWNGGFGAYSMWQVGTTSGSAAFAGGKGSTYCFAARAHDAEGLTSAWTAETCTATPLDDRSLVPSSFWSKGTGASFYANTYSRSTRSGATLTRTGVVARRIAIMVTTCPGCGTVKVYWRGGLIKTLSLNSATVVHRRLFAIATFSTARSGTLVIKVSSSNRRVTVDGVAIRRV
jgi:hypothetical protein